MKESSHPGVICPPPLIYGAGILAALALEWIWPMPFGPYTAAIWVGGALVLLGLAVNLWGAWSMTRARTPISPYRRVEAIVEAGAFRWSRNPLYVGLDLIFVGLFIWLGNPWGIAVFIVVVLVMHYGVILREERYLEARFGQTYTDYRGRVRRYL